MSDFTSKVIGAASQGAVGAVVAASLSAVTEPIVNKILVNRIPLSQAIKELDQKKVMSYLRTTLSTNFIKFPFFEATNVIMSNVEIPPSARGMATGAVFCTTTLPITNYRFRKSMGFKIELGDLYQAYLPTVLRDIIYGVVRNKVMPVMVALAPDKAGTNLRRFCNMFVTVLCATILSAPGNELRGFSLQPPERRQSFGDFFQPAKFVRSTSIGALIMSFSLGVGTLATPQVEKLWSIIREYMQKYPLSKIIVILFAIHQLLETRRNKLLVDATENRSVGK